MGFESRHRNAKFVTISRGQFSFKNGEQKILTDEDLVGTIIDIAIVDDEYNGKKYKKLCLTIDDGKESFQLQIKMGSGYANGFCMAIQNADLASHIRFSASYKEVDGKPKTNIFLTQHGKSLKWFYSKDNPGDLPQLKKVEFKGEVHWDNMAQQEFLTNLLLNVIKPQLSHPAVIPSTDTPPAASPANPVPSGVGVEDDLPF